MDASNTRRSLFSLTLDFPGDERSSTIAGYKLLTSTEAIYTIRPVLLEEIVHFPGQ